MSENNKRGRWKLTQRGDEGHSPLMVKNEINISAQYSTENSDGGCILHNPLLSDLWGTSMEHTEQHFLV